MYYSSRRLVSTCRHLNLLAACIGALLFASPCIASEITIDDASEFQSTDCWVNPVSKARTDCGWLTVPEDWELADGQGLRLPVVIYRALNPDPSLHPVIYLSGGPGYPALGHNGGDIAFWRKTADNHFPGRRLIVFNQRGTGLSSPKLECRDGDGSMTWYPVSINPSGFGDIAARVRTAYAACAARHLAEGRQLSAFNSMQSAADVEALRRALGLQDVILFGISYGTRLALTVMKLYPGNIKAAVLDSVYPPQAENPGTDSKTFGAVLDRLFQACTRDESCSTAYPDLRNRLLRLLEKLAEKPIVLEITNLKSSGPRYVRVDHNMFLAVLRHTMYDTERLAWLPALIADVAQGEKISLKIHAESMVDNYRGFPDAYAMGAMLAVDCNGYGGKSDRQSHAGDPESYSYLEDYAATNREIWPCAIWPTKLETANRDAVVSDIPSLLLAGGLDPSTTVEQAEMAAETLAASHLFVFPANGHVQIRNNECAWMIIDEFLSDPAQRPNPDCLTSLRKPKFVTYDKN